MSRGFVRLGVALLALAGAPVQAQEDQDREAGSVEELDEAGRRDAPNIDEITITGTQSDVTNIQNESKAVSAFN